MIDVTRDTNHKSLKYIDIDVKAKTLVHETLFNDNEKYLKFCNECLQLYVKCTVDLQNHLPFNVSIIKYAQYLHPEKRNIPGATNAISNLALKITSAVESRLSDAFEAHGVLSKEEVCDRIRNQWMIYQNEDICESYYVKEQEVEKKAAVQESYWDCALKQCGLHPRISVSSGHKRIDHYWSEVYKICDENGIKKYPQLFSLVKCVFKSWQQCPRKGFLHKQNYVRCSWLLYAGKHY